MDSASNRAALGVLRDVDAAFTVEAPVAAFQGPFIASASFKGVKPGYAFQTGSKGLGYYIDAQGALAKHAAGASAGRADDTAKTQKDAAQLLQEAEELTADLENLENIDERGIKRIVAGLERRVRKNQEQRMKYNDAAEKFMESELEVHEILQKLLALAGEAELYRQLIAQGSVPLLLQLLHHENLDIACTAVDLLQELTDVIEDLDAESEQLVEVMLGASAVDLMVQRLVTLKEKASEEEESAVFSILTCFQNMIEIDAGVSELLLGKSDFVRWLLQRLNPRANREFSGNKAAAAELLAIAVQVREANCLALMNQGGVNGVLVAVEPYRKLKADLAEREEEEYVHTLCDTLAACLLHPRIKDQFLLDQGVELMLLIVRGKRSFRQAAIKVLNYATTDYTKAAERVIDNKGLNLLFGIFMGKSKAKGVKAGGDTAKEEVEHVLSILTNMFQHVVSRTKRDRLAAKFVENEFEKCDRVMELFFQYHRSLEAALDRIEETGETNEDIIESTKGSAGLFVLQQICVIFGHLWATGDMLLRKRLLMLLHQQSTSLAIVREHLEGMLAAIEDGEDAEKAAQLRSKIGKLVVAVGGSADVAARPRAADPDGDAPPLPQEPPPPTAQAASPPASAAAAGKADAADADPPPTKRVRITETEDEPKSRKHADRTEASADGASRRNGAAEARREGEAHTRTRDRDASGRTADRERDRERDRDRDRDRQLRAPERERVRDARPGKSDKERERKRERPREKEHERARR